MSAQGGVYPDRCVCLGVSTLGVSTRGVSVQGVSAWGCLPDTSLWTEWETRVKTLPTLQTVTKWCRITNDTIECISVISKVPCNWITVFTHFYAMAIFQFAQWFELVPLSGNKADLYPQAWSCDGSPPGILNGTLNNLYLGQLDLCVPTTIHAVNTAARFRVRIRSHWALAMLLVLAGIAKNGHSLAKFSAHFYIAIAKSSVWTERKGLFTLKGQCWSRIDARDDAWKEYIGVFPKCFTKFSDKNICHYSKRTWICHLLCKRPGCYHSTSKTRKRQDL